MILIGKDWVVVVVVVVIVVVVVVVSILTNWCNDRITHSWCEVTAVIRIVVDSREMTRSCEDVHFIIVSTTQWLTAAPITIGCQNVWY